MTMISAVLNSVRHWAVTTPDQPALSSNTETLSYRQLQHRIMQLAAIFAEEGVQVLALAGDNHPQWLAADLAARLAGITLVPLPTFFTPEQINHVLKDAGADHLLQVSSAPATAARDLGHQVSLQRIADAHGSGHQSGRQPISKVTYTSGSTGNPKGVCLSGSAQDRVASALTQAIPVDGTFTHLCTLPLATLLENVAGAYCALMKGQTCAIPSLAELGYSGSGGLNPRLWYQQILGSQPATLIMTPELLRLACWLQSQGLPMPDSLRFIAVGGGKVSPTLLQQAKQTGLPVYEGYGLSECGSVVAVNTPAAERPGSVGKPLSHVQVRIAADGEILVAGNRFSGYLNDPAAATNNATESEWLATGDLGYLDEDGFLFINGRRKNLIINAYGRNISPEWVESELVSNPAIRHALVWGEAQPVLTALLDAADGATDAQLAAAVASANARLPDYARIHQWRRTRTPFSTDTGELTSNGRLRRNHIIDTYQSVLDQAVQSFNQEKEYESSFTD